MPWLVLPFGQSRVQALAAPFLLQSQGTFRAQPLLLDVVLPKSILQHSLSFPCAFLVSEVL